MLRSLSRFVQSWAFRSLIAGACATLSDFTANLVCQYALALPQVACTAIGVAVGGVVGFVLNRKFAFRESSPDVLPQAAKFAGVLLAELTLHSMLNWFLLHELLWHWVPSKLTADFVIFTCVHLFLLRHVVFAKAARPRAGASAITTVPAAPPADPA